MRKVLYIFNAVDWESRIPVAKAAHARGFDVVLGLINPKNDIPETGFKTHILEQAGRNLNPFSTFKLIKDMQNLIRQEQPEIVHTVTLKYGFMAGLAASPYKTIRKIHTLAGLGYTFRGQGFGSRLLKFFISPILKYALTQPNTQLIFQNSDDQSLMVEAGYALAENTTLIRGSGISLEKFSGFEDTREQSAPIILMPTRLVHDKGVAVFIEAAKILEELGTQAVFQIAGGVSADNPNGISQKEMDALLKDSPVEWLGRVSDMPSLLSKVSLVVYPSYYGEGVPRVLLEACAAGRAIVTTDHPGCREAIIDGEGGILVPVKDAMATADAIQSLLDNPKELKQMEKSNLKRAQLEFNISAIAEKTASLYA